MLVTYNDSKFNWVHQKLTGFYNLQRIVSIFYNNDFETEDKSRKPTKKNLKMQNSTLKCSETDDC